MPGFHVNEVAPIAPIVAVLPAQIVVDAAPTVNVGIGLTVSDTVCEFVHPLIELPVTVYIVVAVGVTTVAVPVNAPGFQVYDVAPLPVKVADAPAHIAVGLDIAVKVGIEFTVTETVVVFEHAPLFPVTV